MIDDKWQTLNIRQPTMQNDVRQTKGDGQQTDNRRAMMDDGQETKKDKQSMTGNRRRTSDNRGQTTDYGRYIVVI